MLAVIPTLLTIYVLLLYVFEEENVYFFPINVHAD